jgi:MFS family permease
MQKQIYSIAAILFSMAIFIVGNGLLGLLIPARAHLGGFSDFTIGLIGSSYFAGFVTGCFAGPNLLARVGHIRLFAIGAGIAAATTLLQSLAMTELVWLTMRALFGFAAAEIYMVIESWLNDRSTNETRGRVFSAYLIANFSSLILGQMLYGTARAESSTQFDLCAIAYALCLIPVCLTTLPQPKAGRVPILRPLRLYRMAPVGIVGCIAVGLANGAIWTLAPVYALNHGFTKGWLAVFMSLFTLGGALIQFPLGRFSDRMDRRAIIATVCAISAILGVAIAFSGHWNRYEVFGLVTLFGMSALPLYGLTVAHTNDRIPREDFVEASATLLMLSSLASVIGPPVAAIVIGFAGTSSLFFYTAAIHLSMLVFTLFRLRIKDAPASAHHSQFEPTGQLASPAAAALDPRSPDTSGKVAA